MSRSSHTTTMVEGALCIALSVTLAQFRLFSLPQGGFLSLELAPLLLFACAGLTALCGGSKWFGVTLAAVSQTVCHVVSGVVFFAQYAPEGQNPLVYSLLYNVPIVALNYAASGVTAYFLWRALGRLLPGKKTRE